MRGPAIAAFVALALVAVVGASASRGASRAEPKPATASQWKALVAKAKQEGSVTLYSSQDPNTLATFVQKFKRYDRAKYAKPGKAFAVRAAVQGIGWNTKLFPQGLKDYPDLLNPALAGGKIGVVQPTSPSFVDFYQMLEDHYGKDYIPKLAAQKPKIYLSTLPQLQALASGELAAASLVGAAAIDLKAQGAPVDFVLPKKGAWNAPWVAMVLKGAAHPAAAQLLADYMVTPEGQQAVNRHYGSVLKNIPDTFYVPLRAQKLSNLTPAKISAFQQYWGSLH